MQISHQFTYNEINLSKCKNFIPQKITSSYPITNLLYIINNDNELQNLNLINLNKIFKIITENDFGIFEYDLQPLNLQPFMCRELSRIMIQTRELNDNVINATIYGILADDDDNDFITDTYDFKDYIIHASRTKRYNVISNVFYVIYENIVNEQNTDILLYDDFSMIDFTYERINNTCYKIEVMTTNSSLQITSLLDQTIQIIYKKEYILNYDSSNNIIGKFIQNTKEKIIFKKPDIIDVLSPSDIDVSLPSDMCIKITKFISNKLEEDKLICPLSQDEIKDNGRYYKCIQCKNIFGFVMMSEWLKINDQCPLCRKKWPASDIIHINTNISFIHIVTHLPLQKQIKISKSERDERLRVITNINNIYANYINEINDED